MEMVLPINERAIAEFLKNQRYKVYMLQDNLVFESRHRKPNTWIFYIILAVGFIRLFRQDYPQAFISFGIAITGLIVVGMAAKVYKMTTPDILKVAVTEEGIAFTYRDSQTPKVQLRRDEIDSFHVDNQLNGKSILGHISIKDIHGNWYVPFIIVNRSEEVVNTITDAIINSIKSTLKIE
jgi:hypothetical protein